MLSTGFLQLAKQLIRADTVSAHGTRQAADLLASLWEHAGLAVRRQVVEEIHVNVLGGPGGVGHEAGDRRVRLSGGVLLVTHLDTVPAGPGWQTDPFELVEKDGVLYGLGVADVKLDALCKAEAALRLKGRKLNRPFWLLGTFGEEIGLLGARHFAGSAEFQEVKPREVLCGEPSELQLITAHKGYAVVRCTVRDRKARLVSSAGPGTEELHFAGKAAHSSTPHLGVNAILKALRWVKSSGGPVLAIRGGTSSNVVPASCIVRVPAPREKGEPNPDEVKFLPPQPMRPNLWRALATLGALHELWQEVLPEGTDPRFDPPGAVGGLNVIASVESAVPAADAIYGVAEVSASLDARLLPEHDADGLVGHFVQNAQKWVEELGRGELEVEVATERNAGGMALSPDAELVQVVQNVLTRFGLDPTPRAKPTSTEAGVFARAGCQAAVIGPGRSTGNAHTANERIEMAQLEKACDLYQSLLLELCSCT
jgi:acetylornithine deacetylase/succinyl-diaminopimelate desuccinylase-like protein